MAQSPSDSARKLLGRAVRQAGARLLPGPHNQLRHKIGGQARLLAYKLWPAPTESTRVYSAAVIGAGFGGGLSITALAASNRYRLTSVVDLNRQTLAAVKRAHPQVQTFTDYHGMLRRTPVDVVCVATLAPSHLSIARDLVAHDVRGVLMEKPLAHRTVDARALIDALRDARIPVVVPHGLQATEHVRRIMTRVKSGAIGTLQLIEVECTGWDLMSAGVHWLNFVVALLGADPIDYVTSCCDTRSRTFRDGLQVETLSATTAHTRGGVTIVVTTGDYVDMSVANKAVVLRLIGSAGQIEFYGWEPLYRIVNRRHPGGKMVRVKSRQGLPHQAFLETLARQVDQGSPDYSDAERSLRALEICEAAYLSAKHRCVVPLPLATFTPPPATAWRLGEPYVGGGGRDGRRLPALKALPGHEAVEGLRVSEGPRMVRFGIIGSGWRAQFYLRIARACPDRFQVTGVVARSPEKAQTLSEQFQVPLFGSVEEFTNATKNEFVVSSVAAASNAQVLRQLAERAIPVLSETPPALTTEDLTEVWHLANQGARIQVAEQYWAQPLHASRLAFIASGKIGRVSQVQVSAAHGYHGISLLRRYLGVRFEPVTISGRSFSSRIVMSRSRDALPKADELAWSTQTLAHFDFGDRLGVFDFCDDQYFSYIRSQRVLVRGDRGEVVDDRAVYLQDFTTPIQLNFIRQSAGINGNLEGHHLKGIQVGEDWLYKNPLVPGELSDDEIAIGTCLLSMADYVRRGTPFYDLAEACHDRYLDILMEQSVKSGTPVVSQPQLWSAQ